MQPTRVSTATNPIKLQTLGMTIQLPQGASITPYHLKNHTKQSKNTKQKLKYSHFSYYKLKDSAIVKILFLTPQTYIQISRFPFIQSSDVTKVKNFKELNDSGATRLVTAESLLIGIEGDQKTIVRKLELCKVEEKSQEVDTVEDVFEEIGFGNKERYANVLDGLKEIRLASLRVIVREEGEKAEILDFDYFFAEREFAKRHKPVGEEREKQGNGGEKKVEEVGEKKESKKNKKRGQKEVEKKEEKK